MSDYRRYFVPGGTYFFTVVTQGRAPWFKSATARDLLGQSMRDCFARYPVDVIAMVLLPDHLHTLWALPAGDVEYSFRWRRIKREFTRAWTAHGGSERRISKASERERRRGVWQRRFWEHMIRDEEDFDVHFDYIHFNPVKHGYVAHASQWPWSTFHRWIAAGHYPVNWSLADSGLELTRGAGE